MHRKNPSNMKKITARKGDEQIVKEVIRKYGAVLNLKETPFILIEILRNYGPLGAHDDGGTPGGAPEPPPPPGPSSRDFGWVDNSILLKEILKLGREIKALKSKLT